MDRYLTKEELKNLEESSILLKTSKCVIKAIDEGELKGCEILPPAITDGTVLNSLNSRLNTKADFMYYLDIVGTKRYMQEAKVLKEFIENMDDSLLYEEGIRKSLVFDNKRALVHINAVTTIHDNKYHHIIIFLMQELLDSEEVC